MWWTTQTSTGFAPARTVEEENRVGTQVPERRTTDRPLMDVHPELDTFLESTGQTWTVDAAFDDLARTYRYGPKHQAQIIEVALQLAHLLVIKNKGYGNSALDPISVFAQDVDRYTRLGIRMDDKLSRISRGQEGVSEDTEFDLAGYIVLRQVARLQDAKGQA